MAEARKTALLVDDDESILKIYSLVFGDEGYKVTTAKSLEEAKKYSEETFDVDVIDGLEGKCFDVYDIINARRKIILSGDYNLVKTAKEKGIEAYDRLKKPLKEIIK